MIKKNFDCVEMKHKGAEFISDKISQLSLTDELEFWKLRTQELIEMKNTIGYKQIKGKEKHVGPIS